MTSNLNQRMADYELTHAQLAIIEYLLKKDDSSSLVDIAKYLNVEKSTIVYAFFLLVSRPFTGKLLDTKGDNIVIYPVLLLFAVGLVCLSLSYTNFTMLLAGALIALGFGNMISCSQAIVVNKSPRHRIGLATSTFYIAMDAGIGIGPLIIGIIVPIFGFRGMYMSMALIVFLTIIIYYFVHGKKTEFIKQHSHAS